MSALFFRFSFRKNVNTHNNLQMRFPRYLIATLLVVLVSCASSNSGNTSNLDYTEVPVPDQFISEENPRPDEWAKYPGGKERLDWHIRINTRIPEQARKDGYEGRIILSYEVDEEGEAGNLEVLMSPHQAITDMYSQVISDMDTWQPALLNREPVSQRYYIIASFKAGILPESSEN